MTYCFNCGEKLSPDADFCPRCGTKTAKAASAQVSSSGEEIRQAFEKMSVEIEKAFTLASKEIQNAFQTARESMQKSTTKAEIICGSCKEKNSGDSVYCYNCGKKLEMQVKEESMKS